MEEWIDVAKGTISDVVNNRTWKHVVLNVIS